MRVVFVRHAESTGNAEGIWQGRADFDLSEEGGAQARRLSERFDAEGFQPSHVYSSPQLRALGTAQIVAEPWPVSVVYWDDLMEVGVGIFEGLTWDEIVRKHPDAARGFEESRDWYLVEGAEPSEDRRLRSRRAISTIMRRHTNEDSVLLVTHGGILRHLLATLLGTNRIWGLAARNTALFDFSVDSESWAEEGAEGNPSLWRINRFNDASHLDR